MTTVSVTIDGVPCELEKLADGRIRVQFAERLKDATRGALTGSIVEYLVHPVQRLQYQALLSHLPAEPNTNAADNMEPPRPWWSLAAGERAGFKD